MIYVNFFIRITRKSAERIRNDEATITNIQIEIKRPWIVFVIRQGGCFMSSVIYVNFTVC